MASIIIMKNEIGAETKWIYKETVVTNTKNEGFEIGRIDDIYVDFEQRKIVLGIEAVSYPINELWSFICEFTENSTKIRDFNLSGQIMIKNFNEIYLLSIQYPNDRTAQIILYQYENEDFKRIYLLEQLIDLKESYRLFIKLDNELFFLVVLKKEMKFIMYFFKIINPQNVFYEAYDILETPFNYFFMIFKNFNLYTYNLITDLKNYYTQQIYNEYNYNGLPNNEGIKLLYPNSINIKKANNYIFARNIYNKIVDTNQTISSFNIPSSQINQYEQDNLSFDLISGLNTQINNEEKIIRKNKYEEILVNFINTLDMEDRNSRGRPVKLLDSAIKVNFSISKNLDYDNIKARKYKIIYADGTTKINSISNNQCKIETDTRGQKYANYIIKDIYNPPKNRIKTIQFIANDEKMVYINIDFSNRQTNKIYTINQKLEVK